MKSISGGSPDTSSYIEYPESSAAARIEELKRSLLAELFVRNGSFWKLIQSTRNQWNLRAEVKIPSDRALTGNFFPPDKPEWVDASPVVNMRRLEERDKAEAHNQRVIEYEQAWLHRLDHIVKETIPRELRHSPDTTGGTSNEYGFWIHFMSVCALYDPPETELLGFAEFLVLEPKRIAVFYGEEGNKTTEVFMKAPPIRELADPADEIELAMSRVSLILEEINKRHLKPMGMNIHAMWDDVVANPPIEMANIWVQSELLQKRLYIEVNEQTTDAEARAAHKAIRAKLKRSRHLVPMVADEETRRKILEERHRLQTRSKPNRDPLKCLQSAILYDRHNGPDSQDGRKKRWSFKTLAQHLDLNSPRAAKDYVEFGRCMLSENISVR